MANFQHSCGLLGRLSGVRQLLFLLLFLLLAVDAAPRTPHNGSPKTRRTVAGCALAGRETDRLGGSRRVPLCCSQRNNSCASTGPKLSGLGGNSSKCFCDVGCLVFDDCCFDYKKICPAPVDCQLSEVWGDWSECDALCGRGTKTRRRAVVVDARNGGRPCNNHDAVQKAPCHGAKCKVARTSGRSHDIEETARIIPAKFATWRQTKLYNPLMDIRRNLFKRHDDPDNPLDRPAYCARYNITDVHRTCRKMALYDDGNGLVGGWLSRLTLGAGVCVECQPPAMHGELGSRCRGHGVLRQSTPWKAVTVPGCHGKWTLDGVGACDCDPLDTLSFVFV